MKNKIVIGTDHAGVSLKGEMVKVLNEAGYTVIDKGPFSSESVDYPDFAHLVAKEVHDSSEYTGILICGSGNGVCITANKYKNVRAALCWNKEIASLARLHNDANIICVPARFISQDEAIELVKVFLNTAFEGGRHCNRVEKIKNTL